MALQSLGELGKKAISKESPAGKEVRELEDFLELQSEIDRSQSVSAATPVDWKKVQHLSTSILDTQGKDILVACYLSVALTRNEGSTGFLAGLCILNDFVEGYWEILFPPLKRIRGRRNAITWWGECLQEILPTLESPALSPEDLATAKSLIRNLNATLGEKDPDGPLLNALIPLVSALPVREIEPPPKTGETSSSPPSPTPAYQEPATVQKSSAEPSFLPESDPEETLEQIYLALKNVSETIQESVPTDFRSYRYARMSLWDSITDLPDSHNGITRIPPPPHPVQSALSSMLESGNREDLLAFCEKQQLTYPFWLDLSFHGADTLEQMGEEGKQACEALKEEVRFLTGRLPGIEFLAFSDETPFLSPSGREWVEHLRSGEEHSPDGNRDALSVSAILEPVRLMIGEERLPEAARRFEEARGSAPTGQFRFLLNTEFLSLVIGKGRDFPVEILALSLLLEMERIGLQNWDPSLCRRVIPLLYQVFSQSDDASLQQKADELMRWLVELDLSKAVEIFQKRR